MENEIYQKIKKQVSKLKKGYCVSINENDYFSLTDFEGGELINEMYIDIFVKKTNKLLQLKNEFLITYTETFRKEVEKIFFKKIQEYNEKKHFDDKIIILKNKAIHIFFSKARWEYQLIDIDFNKP